MGKRKGSSQLDAEDLAEENKVICVVKRLKSGELALGQVDLLHNTVIGGNKRPLPGQIGGDVIKRARILHPSQEQDLEHIVHRIEQWLLRNRSALPRRHEALLNAIKPMCKASFHVDSKIIFFHLLFNNVIFLDESGGVQRNEDFSPTYKLQGLLPIDSALHKFSDDFYHVLSKSVSWVSSNAQLPHRLGSFLRSLKQLCSIKREVPPTLVLQSLMKRGVIETDLNIPRCGVKYYMITIQQPSFFGHYMPVVVDDQDSCA